MLKKVSPKNREHYLELANVIDNLKKNNLINSYLGNKGYSIYKVCLTAKIIDFIKDELTLKPVIVNSLDVLMIASIVGLKSTGVYATVMFLVSAIQVPYKSLLRISTPLVS